MSKSRTPRDPFQAIDVTQLSNVSGGASRVTARNSGNDQLTTMMTQLTQSLAQMQNNNQSDPMQMMMMMMMMGGMGGGGGAAAAPPPAAPPQQQAPVINISTVVKRRGW